MLCFVCTVLCILHFFKERFGCIRDSSETHGFFFDLFFFSLFTTVDVLNVPERFRSSKCSSILKFQEVAVGSNGNSGIPGLAVGYVNSVV